MAANFKKTARKGSHLTWFNKGYKKRKPLPETAIKRTRSKQGDEVVTSNCALTDNVILAASTAASAGDLLTDSPMEANGPLVDLSVNTEVESTVTLSDPEVDGKIILDFNESPLGPVWTIPSKTRHDELIHGEELQQNFLCYLEHDWSLGKVKKSEVTRKIQKCCLTFINNLMFKTILARIDNTCLLNQWLAGRRRFSPTSGFR